MATDSGLVHFEVVVAAESVICLPSFVIEPRMLFLMIWLYDMAVAEIALVTKRWH